ncbi:hypothetical protein D3C85_1159590 [compost metagenome]
MLGEYSYSLKDVINLLDPQSRRRAPAIESKAGSRKPRQVKVYKNPHTGELVETKGGNHRTLKEWKAEYGSATVESWLAK